MTPHRITASYTEPSLGSNCCAHLYRTHLPAASLLPPEPRATTAVLIAREAPVLHTPIPLVVET
jgi:hypothetical protein